MLEAHQSFSSATKLISDFVRNLRNQGIEPAALELATYEDGAALVEALSPEEYMAAAAGIDMVNGSSPRTLKLDSGFLVRWPEFKANAR